MTIKGRKAFNAQPSFLVRDVDAVFCEISNQGNCRNRQGRFLLLEQLVLLQLLQGILMEGHSSRLGRGF